MVMAEPTSPGSNAFELCGDELEVDTFTTFVCELYRGHEGDHQDHQNESPIDGRSYAVTWR
jgi:hypothetical protein